jgi:hypothetical protein
MQGAPASAASGRQRAGGAPERRARGGQGRGAARTVMIGSALHRCGAFSSRRLRSCSASNTSLSWPQACVGEVVENAFSR